MLGSLSPAILPTMRNSGILPYTLLNGLALYEYKDVVAMMDEFKMIPKRNKKRIAGLILKGLH